ncbi:MAG: PEP-CTERM sorting domain-containing protein [Armatimonadetes bacterium]|nr:PEP-CTERM sorting domain-containing protein [Armatimonadota bacterium]
MGSITLDVTASLQQQANSGNFYGWALKGIDNPGQLATWDWWATDSLSSSVLTIDYTPVPEPGSMLALGSGLNRDMVSRS